jgi:hypothetical protein
MDDYMREMGELKTLVTKTLEKKGVLARIRVALFFSLPPTAVHINDPQLALCPSVCLSISLYVSLSLSLGASSIAKDCCGTMEVLLLFSLPLDVRSC